MKKYLKKTRRLPSLWRSQSRSCTYASKKIFKPSYCVNQKGAALIIVLLIFTVFTLMGLSVIGLTISNSKQINKTEEDIQATDIAEMGFQYFFTAFSSAYEEVVPEVKQALNDKIDADNARNSDQDPNNDFTLTTDEKEEYYREFAIHNLYSLIDNKLDDLSLTQQIADDRKFTIQLTEFYCNVDPNNPTPPDGNSLNCISPDWADDDKYTNIILGYSSIGELENNIEINKKIGATFTINVGFNLSTEEGGDDSGGSDSWGNLNFDSIISEPAKPDTSTLPDCPEGSTTSTGCAYDGDLNFTANTTFENSTTYVDGEFSTNRNVSFSNATLYATGGGTFNGVINDISDSTLYFGGDSSFENINGLTNSTLYIDNGTATFNAPLNGVTNSEVFVGGDTTFKNINQILNSFMIIDGNAYFNSNLNSFDNSTIYISGDANFNNNHINGFDNSDSKICVYGQVLDIFKNNSNDNIYVRNSSSDMEKTNDDLFIEKCGVSELTTENLQFIWDLESTEINYQYN